MPLTALKVLHAKPGRHADGYGLYLYVRPSGAKSWVLRIYFGGRRRDFGLGPVFDISLAEARSLASDYRKMIRSGIDPSVRAQRKRAVPSFETVTRQCYEAMKESWSDGRCASWIASFDNHVFPLIGSKDISQIDSTLVLEVLEPVWLKIPHTARRLLQRIGTVLDYAHIKGHIPNEISLKSVTRGLPRQGHKVTHLAAMSYKDVPAFMVKLCKLENSAGRDALKFTLLNTVRSNETRFAIWDEIDLEQRIWTISGKRMKMKVPHIVPLSPQATSLLKRLRHERLAFDEGPKSNQLIFTGSREKPLSDVTMVKAMRDMGIERITVHGFRSSFTDWTADCTDYPKEIADKALAHHVPDAVEAAYRRTDYFEKRRLLMNEWGSYVSSQLGGKI